MASAQEKASGLMAISRIRESNGLRAVPDPQPAPPEDRAQLHDEGCAYCRREACWACEHLGLPLAQCRHEKPARHGAGDLENPPLPEPEPESEEVPSGE